MKNCDEVILNWLNNAYSMEAGLAETLERHAHEAEEAGNIEMANKLKEHQDETQGQAEMIKERIEELGGKTSSVKSFFGKIMGEVQGVATEGQDDQLVKNAIMEYAAEHFEKATYKSIILAAEECGDEKTASLCYEIMGEESDTGKMLDRDLPNIVKEYISKEEE